MIRESTEVETVTLPGIVHQTLAGPRDGMKNMEVWMQTVAPGAETPMHRHDCEEVIVVLAGSGICEIEGEVRSFGAGATIVVPRNAVHRIANSGSEPMQLVAGLSAAPVLVHAPDGTRIPLPWDQAA